MATLKVPVTAEDHIQGSSNAPITLVEYGDYECPYCGMAYFVIKQLQEQFGDSLRFVFRNFPLIESHPHAAMAAEAAEFAASNKKFWPMHDLIYENQSRLSVPFLSGLGKQLDISSQGIINAIEERKFEKKIHNDFLGGVKSGVNGTPTLFINGQRYDGPVEAEDLAAAFQSILV